MRLTCHGHSEGSAIPSRPESFPFFPHLPLLCCGPVLGGSSPTGLAPCGTKQHTLVSERPQ